MGQENRIHVRFFAIFREMIGLREDWVEGDPGLTVEQLWKRYAGQARNPRVANIRAAYSVNGRLAAAETVLSPGDEVGFLPPVSGGGSRVRRPARRTSSAKRTRPAARRPTPKRAKRAGASKTRHGDVTPSPLDLGSLIVRVEDRGAGAIVTFSGVVRNNSQGQETQYLEYEAYPDLARNTFVEIEEEIRARWPDVRVAMAHRTGHLEIGEASVIIAASAPHRANAFGACRYAIERIKAVLPVWKKEFTPEGDYWVEGPLAGETPPERADEVVRAAESEAE